MRRAFTLIELLVVVAIIAVLVSILLPALSKAREEVRKVSCLSNNHNLTLAMTQYAMDYSDRYPITSPDGESESYWSAWATYSLLRPWPPSGGSGHPVGYGLLWRYGYLRDFLFFYCPARDKTLWPAWNLFDKHSGWNFDSEGYQYPRASCYNLRGWEEKQGNWKVHDYTEALTADIFFSGSASYYTFTFTNAHKTGVNVGFSDGAAKFIPADTNVPSEGMSFSDVILTETNRTYGHHTLYNFFDTQH